MSYDVSIEGGNGDANYTYNVSPMFRLAGCPINDLNDMTGREAAPILRAAIINMIDHPAEYEKLNPPNGWGDYGGAIGFLAEIRAMCLANPDGRLLVG